MKIAIGSDHAGFDYKEKVKGLLSELGHSVRDFGTHTNSPVDLKRLKEPVHSPRAGAGCFGY